jgi:DNA-binding SARP family transcriptional activator/DNA-binding XRE family transcriptional regulator
MLTVTGRPQGDPPDTRPAQEPAGRFGELLRTHRRHAGLTQRDLADRTGLSTGAIRDLEQGRTRSPKSDSIDAIAAALALNGRDASSLHTFAKAHRSVTTSAPGNAGRLHIGVLGPLGVRHGDIPVPVNSGPQRTLLARLALSAGTTVSQDELIDLLWPRDVPRNAVNLLHTRVARLRRLLEAGRPTNPVIVSGGAGYRLELNDGDLDLLTFRDLTARAARAEPAAALAKLSDAVALWRGDTDVEPIAANPLYVAISNEYTAAVRAFSTLARDLGDPEQALEPLRNLTAQHELDEPLHVELIQSLAACGRQVEALAAYDRIRSALAEQLGIDPGERLRAVHLEVLRQQSRQLVRTTGLRRTRGRAGDDLYGARAARRALVPGRPDQRHRGGRQNRLGPDRRTPPPHGLSGRAAVRRPARQ